MDYRRGWQTEMGKRYIDADALKDKARELLPFTQNDAVWAVYNFWDLFDGIIDNAPTADVVERKKGKWIEKEVMSVNESKAIDEWQSCRCSVCGRYDTRPYMYYFSNPNFCSWCGAEMKGEEDGSL